MAPAKWKIEQGERIYETPYLRLPNNPMQDVLIIGAGSGSDVAIALREGARRVDAERLEVGDAALVAVELVLLHELELLEDELLLAFMLLGTSELSLLLELRFVLTLKL